MLKQFQVNILTPQGKIFAGVISSLIVPAALGYLGVLASHAPLIASLVQGKIIINEGSGLKKVIYNTGKGFLEVKDNQATIILDTVE